MLSCLCVQWVQVHGVIGFDPMEFLLSGLSRSDRPEETVSNSLILINITYLS